MLPIIGLLLLNNVLTMPVMQSTRQSTPVKYNYQGPYSLSTYQRSGGAPIYSAPQSRPGQYNVMGGYRNAGNGFSATTPTTLGAATSYQPASGGQPAANTGGGGGGDTGGGDPFAGLRQAYDYARSMYEQQFPALESDYNRVKGDVEGAVQRAKQTLGEQKQDIEVGYGKNLRDLLTRGNELGQKTRNTYSGLNALDSSSYADEQTKQGQALFDAQNELGSTKTRSLTEADRAYADYESKSTGYLADLGKQYMAGKQALQQAIADNNVEEANSILGWMQQLSSTMANAKVQLAGLQAQGTDVVGNLKKLNSSGLDSIFGNYLSKIYNPGIAGLSSVGAPQVSGSGYISPRTGRRYGSYQDFLASEG